MFWQILEMAAQFLEVTFHSVASWVSVNGLYKNVLNVQDVFTMNVLTLLLLELLINSLIR